jgi:hypothetical protein
MDISKQSATERMTKIQFRLNITKAKIIMYTNHKDRKVLTYRTKGFR